MTPFQAMGMTKDILFHNANTLYDLRYEAVFDERIPNVYRQLDFNAKTDPSSSHKSPIVSPAGDPGLSNQSRSFETPAARSVSPYPPPSFPPPPKAPQVYDINRLDRLRQANTSIKFVYMQWTDYTALVHERIIPIKAFDRMIRGGERLEVPQGSGANNSHNDSLTSMDHNTGLAYIEPDLRSLRINHSKDGLPSATVLCYSRDALGNARAECPRNSLETLLNNLQYNFSTTLLVGFEIEVTFLSRNTTGTSPSYEPLSKTKAWGGIVAERSLQLPFLSEIALALDEMDIEVQQLHAGSGPGQYTFALAPLPALSAVDTLIQARQVIQQIAAHNEVRATLHPRPCQGIATAAHAKMLLEPPDRDMQFFVGGVLEHLAAICAFSLSGEASYGGDIIDDHQYVSRT